MFGFHSAVNVAALVFFIFSTLDVCPDNMVPFVITEIDQDGTIKVKIIGGGFLKSIAIKEMDREGAVRKSSF